MKQKIVHKVQVNCDKCRLQAMKLISSAQGVDSIAIDGKDKDCFVVIGDGVDSIKLAKILRKNGRHADIVSVDEVKEKKEKEESNSEVKEKEEKEKEESKCEEPKVEYVMQWYPYRPVAHVYEDTYNSGSFCSVM